MSTTRKRHGGRNANGAQSTVATPPPAAPPAPGRLGSVPDRSTSPAPPAPPALQTPPPPALGEYLNGQVVPTDDRGTLALFCFEPPDSFIGKYMAKLAGALVARKVEVHIFSQEPFELTAAGVRAHPVGRCTGNNAVEQVQEFTRRATETFLSQFPAGSERVSLVGHEWSAVPSLTRLQQARKLDSLLMLSSLERQRSDMSNPISKQIDAIEVTGLCDAKAILVHDAATAEVTRYWSPDSARRMATLRPQFPTRDFESSLDPGAVKARHQIGPIDPTILYIGDMDNRHAPDVLMKSVPAVLRNHKQARFAFVGDGDLFWPMKVHARYLLLDNVVRLLGHLADRPLFDLIQASDMVVVPSREATEWWPVQAAWAASRPVIVSEPVAKAMRLEHEHDCVRIYAHESSCVWGIERLLYDETLRTALARRGRQKLEERFGWNVVAEQVEELLGIAARA